MKATEAKLLSFLQKSPQFIIPIYQRTYSWTQPQCQQLWDDILRTGSNDDIAAHFVGSIVYYFRDKRAILLELLHDTVEQVADLVVQGLAPESWTNTDPRESVRKLLELVFHSRTVRPGLQRILWERFFKDPEVRSAVEAIEERVRGAIGALLEALRAEGRTRIEDAATAAFVVHLSVEWTATRVVLGGSSVDVDDAVDAAADMISRYIFS